MKHITIFSTLNRTKMHLIKDLSKFVKLYQDLWWGLSPDPLGWKILKCGHTAT